MSKGTMDTFNLSVTSAVPELALVELGYTDAEIAKTIVNPVEGENFAPAFLKIENVKTLVYHALLAAPSSSYSRS
ncbi:hypothetical protein JAAARDRAFT_192116 [Jaapia argillacea MUCL 33604]|uniref:Uncharacterized protein n=1 Tax=Jaapia argillacea MUCL 33604 TaxID=933084 RepID=A0A067Q0D1_9AGAM|nr:hypothetical protein JAAARDRAFT_192116 [Jaapia argillacea MUCL 33604]